MKKILSIFISLSIALMMIPSMAFADNSEESYEGKTIIIYTGNLRGDINNYAKLAQAKKDIKDKGADAVYLVDAGNYLQGKTYANSDRGKSIYELMDAAGYDVAAMGAYEFSYVSAAFASMASFTASSTLSASRPCTKHASCKDSACDDGQPRQCIPFETRVSIVSGCFETSSPTRISFVTLLFEIGRAHV